tara:strand:- start:444 stop:713 length:270 start_codon:yes stop_codon:yes gene_type:complete
METKKAIIDRHIKSMKMNKFNENFPHTSAIAIRDALIVGMTSRRINEEIIRNHVSMTSQILDKMGMRTHAYMKDYNKGFNLFLNQILYI